MVMVIGYRQAGALGAAVVAAAFFLPDCILTFFANRLWGRFSGSRWRSAIQRGLAPVAIGLMLSGTYSIARLSILNWMGAAIAVATMAILLWRRINPTVLISIAGIAYIVYARL
jgi:chromate transporter